MAVFAQQCGSISPMLFCAFPDIARFWQLIAKPYKYLAVDPVLGVALLKVEERFQKHHLGVSEFAAKSVELVTPAAGLRTPILYAYI